MSEKLFKGSGRFMVFATVFVRAKTEKEARRKIAGGASTFGAGNIEFDNATAEVDELESLHETTEESEDAA